MVNARDLAFNGATTGWVNRSTVTNLFVINGFSNQGTVRANAASAFPAFGSASRELVGLWATENASGTTTAYRPTVEVKSTGTGGYSSYDFNTRISSYGSGSSSIISASVDDTARWTVSSNGLHTLTGNSGLAGDIVYLNPDSGQISIYPSTARNSFFGPLGTANQALTFNYGTIGGDRRASFYPNAIDFTDNLTGATGKSMVLNFSGGPITLGAASSVVNLPGMIVGTEIADPSAPASNSGTLYFRDNGSGKTQLVVRFPTGAIQVISTEP